MNYVLKISFIFIFLLGWTDTNAYSNILDKFKEKRSHLEEKGVQFEGVYKFDYIANTQGGLDRKDTYLTNLDLIITINTDQLGLWKHGTIFFYVIENSGGQKITGSIVGDTNGVYNIEAPRTMRLYEMWYEHIFLDDSLSVLLGFHDYNSEFDTTEYGGLFLNSSFGITVDISGGGRPSIFPLAAPAIRVKVMPKENLDILFAIYDGDPGDADISDHFPRSDFDTEGGAFFATELTYRFPDNVLPGFFKFGVWYNTGDFDDVLDTNADDTAIKREGNTGGYIIIDKMLFQEKDNELEGLGAFFQFGSNKENVNEVHMYVGGGLHYRGLVPRRGDDYSGIAIANAIINDDIMSAGGRYDHETTIEATYQAQITDNIRIQPDIQYVFHPGAALGVDNALVIGVRLEITF